MTTWTIRADEILDKLVEENVRALGYTSKAELVREAVREFILKRNMGRLGLRTLNNQKREAEGIDPRQAFNRLSSLTNDKKLVKKVITEEREIVEKALLKVTGAGTN